MENRKFSLSAVTGTELEADDSSELGRAAHTQGFSQLCDGGGGRGGQVAAQAFKTCRTFSKSPHLSSLSILIHKLGPTRVKKMSF